MSDRTEAEFYIDTNAHLSARVAVIERELAAAQAREAKLREAMRLFIKEAESYGETWARCYVADFDRVAVDSKKQRFRLLAVARDRLKSVGESMVEPADRNAALLEMIEAAKVEEREAIIAKLLKIGALGDGDFIAAIRAMK